MSDPVVHLTNGVPDSGTGNITTLGQTLVDGANATHGVTTGAAVVTDAAGTFQQYLRGLVKLLAAATFKAASTAPVATDPALVVALSPNTNGQAAMANSLPVAIASNQSDVPIKLNSYGNATTYKTVPASATAQVLGSTGAVGDYLGALLIVAATTSPGAVSITDGAGSAITVFTGGASSVSNLVPFAIPIGAKTTSGAWKVTTGANVSVVAVGQFT